MTKTRKTDTAIIAHNKRARHDYTLMDRLEAGIALQGWEVKSLRAARVQLDGAHVLLRAGNAFLFGSRITPLPSASTHIQPQTTRDRPLLMHRRELARLIGLVERKGYTLVPLALYWKQGKVKLEIATAKGKKQHDKRETEKKRDWHRQKARLLSAQKRS